MIKNLTSHIISFMLDKSIIDEENIDIYVYGVKRLLAYVVNIIIICLIAAVLQKWIETICFFIGLMPIRAIAGGYHASTQRNCNALSIFVYLLNIFIIDLLSIYAPLGVNVILSIFIMISIICFAPVDHKNMTLTLEEFRAIKVKSILIALILVITTFVCTILLSGSKLFVMGIMMGTVTASISIIIGYYIRRRERYEENELVS